MAGTPHGRIDCKQLSGLTTQQHVQTVFVSLYKAIKAWEALGLCSELANNFGNGSGFNYHDEANPIGASAFVLFKLPPSGSRAYSLHCLVQYCGSSALGTANNAQIAGGAFSAHGGLGITFAAALTAEGVDASPLAAGWGSAKAGADAKPNPAWAAPAGGKLWVGNRANAPGGDDAAAGCDLHKLVYFSSSGAPSTSRWGALIDADNLAFYYDQGDDGAPALVAAVQVNVDNDFAAFCPFKHAALRVDTGSSLSSWFNKAIGNTSGSLDFELVAPGAAGGDAKLGGFWCGATSRAQLQPNAFTAKYSEDALEVFVEEGVNVGIIGVFDSFLGAVANLACYSTLNTTAARKRVVIGGATLGDMKFTLPWDGATTPQAAGATRDGVDF